MVDIDAARLPLDPSVAYEAAVSVHGSSLFGLALAILGNRADAEDAYQLALEQARRGLAEAA